MIKPENPLDNHCWFAGFNLPFDSSLTHFAFVGSTGSGKTISQRFLYQTGIANYIAIEDAYKRGRISALMYDAKGDLFSILFGFGERNQKRARNERYLEFYKNSIITLNPFDNRSYAWDIAKDVKDEATALEIANILIPENENESQPFFRQAARDLLSGVMTAYVYEATNKWTLRDVLYPLLCEDLSILKNVLEMSEYSSDRLQHFNQQETFQNILGTIRTELKPLQLIASLWHQAYLDNKRFSIDDWVNSTIGKVLILGNSYKLRESLKKINQVIFKRTSQILLDLPELQPSETRKTWVCIDELAQLGELDGLNDLLTNGRSKGVSMVLGFQDFDSLKDIYGEEQANVIWGQCASKAIFRLGSGSSAKWASEQFGEKERIENKTDKGVSVTQSSEGGSSTKSSNVNSGIENRSVILQQDFLTIPMTSQTNGLTGIYFSPFIKEITGTNTFIKRTIDGDFIESNLCKKASDTHDFENNKRPAEHQKSIAWTQEDFDRLGVQYLNKLVGEPKEITEEENRIDHIKTQL
jgi:Type IV secretion-system coupling protein DNA-binding domain